MTRGFSELAVQFGPSASLVGILSRPLPEFEVRRTAVVILNTGIAHRIGHHRMYVTMARDLAKLGHLVFRFDFSGIGDSAGRDDSLSPTDAHQADLADALDWLTENCDVQDVVLIGLCAGAEIALRYGYKDQRVLGMVLLDPTVPPTPRFYAQYIARRLVSLRSWLSFASGRGRIWQELSTRAKRAVGAEARPAPGTMDDKVRNELEHLYGQALDRDLKLLIVLTAGTLDGRQNYREQLFDALPNVPLRGRAQVEYYKDADHTFTSPVARERLQDLVYGWVGGFQDPDRAAGPADDSIENSEERSRMTVSPTRESAAGD